MLSLTLLGVFLTGLLAGVHCAGMCGGIVTALSIASKKSNHPTLSHLLAYNAGRIGSYAVAGALMGALGASGLLLGPAQPLQQALYIAANLMLVALGLYLAGLWNGVMYLERAGSVLWRRIQPLARYAAPVRSVPQALMLGALWGWVPCGLVYSMLVAAFAWASPLNGALVMIAFGLGTLPNLILLGYFAGRLRPWLQRRDVRLIAGLLVIGFGVVGLLRGADLISGDSLGLFCITPAYSNSHLSK
ncbi:MAG TPA: sulfite exporter TauE/SafE family protein [Burkholderiales bacterium]|nr:sulfite exporter TauE/SafE family protein [Burkholderiales bacterium]